LYSSFSKNITKKDGLNNYCKICQKKYREKNKIKNNIYQQKYRKINKSKLYLQNKIYRINNKQKIRERDRKYRIKNKNKIRIKHKEWSSKNKEYIRQYKNKQYHDKYKHSLENRLRSSLRSRLRLAIGKGKKCTKTMDLIGCSLQDLRLHIEKQFINGMSWDNYGINGWHIDHIKPCSSFDLTKIKEQKICFHYTNLQPLWAKDNLIKSNKL
jgi:hypothetical protein